MSPTERSLALLRKEGYLVGIVEKWNPHARIRQDLYGFIDLLAVRPGETLGVQATSGDHVQERIRKIAEHENYPRILEAGWVIEVWGWRKLKAGWACRREKL